MKAPVGTPHHKQDAEITNRHRTVQELIAPTPRSAMVPVELAAPSGTHLIKKSQTLR